jgi:glycosyltransferase involved in cell wall biosynthesis
MSSLASGVPETVFEVCELAYNLWETPRLFWRAWRMHPDLLYVRYSLFTFAPALVSGVLKVPFVLEINDATFITRSRPLALQRTASRLEGYIFRSASLCVTISRQFAELACHEWNLDRRKFVVLPNAVTPDRFTPRPSTGATGGPVLGVVGAFVAWHGLDFLVEAVAQLHASHPEIRVLLVGDGPIRADVEAQVKRLKLDEVVQFTGFVPPSQVAGFLSQMDICIIPDSNSHGSPMKLFEYMAMGKPTVSPRYSPIAEVIEDGETGLLFTPRDRGDFCRQTERLLREPALAQKIGRQARQVVLEKHTWEANVRSLLAQLQRVSETPVPRL